MYSSELVGRHEEGQLQLDFNVNKCPKGDEAETYEQGVTVQSFSSKGQTWRVYSRTTGKVHEYFSKLEYCVHLLLDLNPNVVDIMAQYPHDLVKSSELSYQLGINHPPQNSNKKKPLTTDIVAEFKGVDGGSNYNLGFYIKYAQEFKKFRTVEKLHLERESLAQMGIQLRIATEETIEKTIMKSIDWMLTVDINQLDGELTMEYAAELYEALQEHPDKGLAFTLNQLDKQGGLQDGYYLKELKCLLQHGLFFFDLTKNVHSLECGDIELIQEMRS